MRRVILLLSGVGALVALVGGLTGMRTVLGLGAGAMIMGLFLLPWTRDDDRA